MEASTSPLSPDGRKTSFSYSSSKSLGDDDSKEPQVSQEVSMASPLPRWVNRNQPFGLLPIFIQLQLAEGFYPLPSMAEDGVDTIHNWDRIITLLETDSKPVPKRRGSVRDVPNHRSSVLFSVADEAEEARSKAKMVLTKFSVEDKEFESKDSHT